MVLISYGFQVLYGTKKAALRNAIVMISNTNTCVSLTLEELHLTTGILQNNSTKFLHLTLTFNTDYMTFAV